MSLTIAERRFGANTVPSSALKTGENFNFTGDLQHNGQAVATEAYAQNLANGQDWKDSVEIATTANITLSGEQTIDGELTSASRVLVKNQTTQSENGIYVSASGAWSRASDMDGGSEFSSAVIPVEKGASNGDSVWICTNNGTVNVGSDNITFTTFPTTITAGTATEKVGNAINVKYDDSSVGVNGSNQLEIKALGVTNAMLAGSIANAKLANSTISGKALGANLDSLSAGDGLSMTAYNGSASVSDLTIDIDGDTLSKSGTGLKVADGSIGDAQLENASIKQGKLAFGAGYVEFTGNGVLTSFDLAGAVDLDMVEFFPVFADDGLAMRYKSTPTNVDEYKIDNGGSGGVGRVVLGSALPNGEIIQVRVLVDD